MQTIDTNAASIRALSTFTGAAFFISRNGLETVKSAPSIQRLFFLPGSTPKTPKEMEEMGVDRATAMEYWQERANKVNSQLNMLMELANEANYITALGWMRKAAKAGTDDQVAEAITLIDAAVQWLTEGGVVEAAAKAAETAEKQAKKKELEKARIARTRDEADAESEAIAKEARRLRNRAMKVRSQGAVKILDEVIADAEVAPLPILRSSLDRARAMVEAAEEAASGFHTRSDAEVMESVLGPQALQRAIRNAEAEGKEFLPKSSRRGKSRRKGGRNAA